MKDLGLFLSFSSANDVSDFIEASKQLRKYDLLVVRPEKSGLTHFYVRIGKMFYRILSEPCRSWSVLCHGRILQLEFNRHKALFYVDDDGKAVSLGASFVEVGDLRLASDRTEVVLTEECPVGKTDVCLKNRLLVYCRLHDEISLV